MDCCIAKSKGKSNFNCFFNFFCLNNVNKLFLRRTMLSNPSERETNIKASFSTEPAFFAKNLLWLVFIYSKCYFVLNLNTSFLQKSSISAFSIANNLQISSINFSSSGDISNRFLTKIIPPLSKAALQKIAPEV